MLKMVCEDNTDSVTRNQEIFNYILFLTFMNEIKIRKEWQIHHLVFVTVNGLLVLTLKCYHSDVNGRVTVDKTQVNRFAGVTWTNFPVICWAKSMTPYISAEKMKARASFSLLTRGSALHINASLTSHSSGDSVLYAFMITCWLDGILAIAINYSLSPPNTLGTYLLVFLIFVNYWHK